MLTRSCWIENQTVPFFLPVIGDNGVNIYAWLIAPLKVFADREKEFLDDKGPLKRDVESSMAFKCLREDPEARLLIYCMFHIYLQHCSSFLQSYDMCIIC